MKWEGILGMAIPLFLVVSFAQNTRVESLLAHLSNSQTQIDRRILSDHKANAGSDSFRKAFFCHPDLVGPNGQSTKPIPSTWVCRNGTSDSGIKILGGNRGGGHRRTGRVCDQPREARRYLSCYTWPG